MTRIKATLFALLFACTIATLLAAPATAQTQIVQPKPRMYSYVSNWQIPRAHWPDMTASEASDNAIAEKAMSDGLLVGYGTDENLVHTPDGWTHDDWFSAMSMGDLIKVLEQYYTQANPPQVLQTATSHWDLVLTSRYYNWKPGASYKDGIVSVSGYKLKSADPDSALTEISGEVVAPLLENLLADGTILEYEIDTQAVHTSAPGMFWIITVVQDPADLDKVDDAIRADIKAAPITGASFDSLTDWKAHRDGMELGTGKFK